MSENSFTIVRSGPEHHRALSDITFHSKAHWGYSTEQMEAWREELTLLPAEIIAFPTYHLQIGLDIAGYYSYKGSGQTDVLLENLFVHPAHMGKGLGKHLLKDCLRRVHAQGYRGVRLEADPHAEGFYLRQGFRVLGKFPSSIPGRSLPIMYMPLEGSPAFSL